MNYEGKYVDLVLCGDDEGAPLLALAPCWSHLKKNDIVKVEIGGEEYVVTVEKDITYMYNDDDYRFAVACFGDDPRAIVTKELRELEMDWKDYKEAEDDAVRAD